MSEQIAPTTEPSTEGATMPSATPNALEGQDGDEQLGEAGKRALERERAERKKAAAERDERGAKLKAIEDSQKSDAERVAERLAAAEARAADLESRALRAEVAAEKGVPVALLTGTTREELDAQADALIEFRGEQKRAPASPAISRANGVSPKGSTADQFASFLEGKLA